MNSIETKLQEFDMYPSGKYWSPVEFKSSILDDNGLSVGLVTQFGIMDEAKLLIAYVIDLEDAKRICRLHNESLRLINEQS